MARPTKQGIDYFPMDCDPDGKLELFIAENGCDGFGLLVMIWQMIYKGEGYYIKKDDDLVLRLRKESLLSTEKIVSVIENSIKRGIFSIEAVDKHGILTSSGIQKRFFPAAKRKKQVTVVDEYLLISVSEFVNLVIVSKNMDSVYSNATKEKEKEEVNTKQPKKRFTHAESDITRIYEAYPKHVGGSKALAAIDAALNKIDADELLSKVVAYARSVAGTDQKFIPLPTTWMNQERWIDEVGEAFVDWESYAEPDKVRFMKAHMLVSRITDNDTPAEATLKINQYLKNGGKVLWQL